MVRTYVAARRLKIGEGYREPGELWPEGHLYRLIESSLHSGHAKDIDVSETDFLTAVDQFCPEHREALCRLLNIAVPVPQTQGVPA